MRRVGAARRVATLVQGGRRSLPKAVPGAGESLEAAALRAGEAWTGRALELVRPAGVALLDIDGQPVAAWFHLARVRSGAATHSPAASGGGWRLEWVSPAVARLELAQLDERRLAARELGRRGAARWLAVLPGSGAARSLAAALTATLAFAVTGAELGWLAAPDAGAATGGAGGSRELARLVGAALLGGWVSAAAGAVRGAQRRPPARSILVGALAGAVCGALLAALLAGGALAAITLTPGGALLVAWLGGFLERPARAQLLERR